jgi:hypothetical protein
LEKSAMTTSGMIGAAALLAAVITAPAIAQDAMQQPGAYARRLIRGSMFIIIATDPASGRAM